jgi:holo-[acyl-carrier protein] synthase
MDIIGIGIDITEVDRIRRAVTRHTHFLTRVYAEKEVRLSNRGSFRFEELAGRFAAKEAIFKAIKTGWRQGVKFTDITILNEPSGAPYAELAGTTEAIADSIGVRNIFISISHTKHLAIAMAVVTT